MYSLLIKNATVIDGSGLPGRIADVAVSGDLVVNIDRSINAPAETVIDATDKVLVPGFIDIQNHSDTYWQIFDNPNLDSLVTQGFTTALLGNCGGSLAPLLSRQALLSVQKWHELSGSNINWQSFSEYAAELSRHRFGCNLGSLVGYSTLRRGLVGDEIRGLDKNELAALKRILEQSLDAGAFGLSSGLSYAHEIIISELELFELVSLVAKAHALFSVHLRSEGSEIIESIEETLEIARSTDVTVKISHLKIRGSSNYHKLGEVTERLDNAYTRGTRILYDIYPYDTVWQPLYSYLPKWVIEGGRTLMLKQFTDPVQKQKVLSYLHNLDTQIPEILIASTANKLNLVGKRVGDIAKNLGISSEETVLELIQNGGTEVLVFEKNLDYAQVEQLLAGPQSMIATDGAGFPVSAPDQIMSRQGIYDKLPHPRCFGTAPKYLKETLAKKLVPLEQAIRKLTALPAQTAGFKKRGEIQIDYFADLVLFDPKLISDSGDYSNPFRQAKGITHVWVNGKGAVIDGVVTKNLSGYFLRKA